MHYSDVCFRAFFNVLMFINGYILHSTGFGWAFGLEASETGHCQIHINDVYETLVNEHELISVSYFVLFLFNILKICSEMFLKIKQNQRFFLFKRIQFF